MKLTEFYVLVLPLVLFNLSREHFVLLHCLLQPHYGVVVSLAQIVDLIFALLNDDHELLDLDIL